MERFLYRVGFAVLGAGFLLVMSALCSCESVNAVRVLDLTGAAGAETLGVRAVDVRTGQAYAGSVTFLSSGAGIVATGPVPGVVYFDEAGVHVGAAWPGAKDR